ncbi:N-acetylmuramoyl-L-alanine amidase [Macrococcus capreoli]|uniref:N-acetylmuramoyl-L-alanine amidase n=1 Tax=Macrococcus capreoli TaxID=2982690 RepID=UPI0021D59EAF|nr:N-acetylmuramoyl-L-alanine amidase [Macrococcus sp. TMW 2.2395]MCU7557513.1 glucosaminidase domain-containing protein [Macrococcus sp. TMW 2.2395]
MDNKFYYKTPALMLMMLAGTTTVAYAAENEVQTPDTQKPATTTTAAKPTAKTTTVTAAKQAKPVNVIATKDLTKQQSLTAQYSLSQVKKNTNVQPSVTKTVVKPTTQPVAKTTVTKPVVKTTTQPVAKTVATKPVVKPTAQPVTKTVATKPVAKTTAQPVAKTVATKPVAKTTAQPVAKTVATKPVAKTTAQPVAKTVATKPVAKTTAQPVTAKKAILSTRKVRTLTRTAPVKAKNVDNMSVNEYIKYNNWAVPKYEESYFDSPQIAYRNGVGKPEGIVAHETANPTSTIDGEINYMKNNYENAFVHAFVDDKRIVEVANTDYLSWGAGPQANPRFINVELVRVYGKDAFSRSINNYADYFATNLLYYGLPLDNADYDGEGTVWNHKAVSNFLGGTDHTDPIGWFEANNYTFDEFYSLVTDKYNQKLNSNVAPTPAPTPVTPKPVPTTPAVKPVAVSPVKTSTEQRMAKIKSATADVYTTVSDKATTKAGNKADTAYYVNKKAEYNGDTYYALTDENKIPRGWVKANDTTSAAITNETATSKRFVVNSKATNIYTTPWGSAKQAKASLKPFIGKDFVAQKTVKVGATPFYYGTVNAIAGWVNFSDLSAKLPPVVKPAVKPAVKPVTKPAVKPAVKPVTKPAVKPAVKPVTKPAVKPAVKPVAKPAVKPAIKPVAKPVTQLVNTSNERRIAKIKSDRADIFTSITEKATAKAGSKSNTAYYVNKKAVFNGVTYYALTDDANIPRGWVKAADTISYAITPETKTSNKFTLNNKATNLLTTPWGSTNQVKANVKSQIGKVFTASKFVKVGTTPFYFGTVNTLTGWISADQLNTITPVKANAPIKVTEMKNVKLIGRTDARNTVLYPNINSTKKASTKPVDMAFYINQSAKKNNEKFFSLSDHKNKFIGWISDTFIKEKPYTTVSWTKAAYKIKKPTGFIYTMPDGSKAQRIKQLNALKTNIVHVIRTDKVGHTLWHKILLPDNTTGYVADSDLFSQNIQYVKAPESLNVAVTKQLRLQNKAMNTGPKVIYSTPQRAYNERLASANEIKAQLSTKDKMDDAQLKYQFLDLGQSEGISAKQLNKLLIGKGALENQGAAFAIAAKQFKINEIYLIAHAILETGHGKSRLANGLGISADNKHIVPNAKKKYYNMYGSKAIDNNVELGGITYAKQNGWDSVSKAIIGGAKYVREAYINQGQRTLHQMRWNPEHSATHQYATDISWASQNARTIARLYNTIGIEGKNYIVHDYK